MFYYDVSIHKNPLVFFYKVATHFDDCARSFSQIMSQATYVQKIVLNIIYSYENHLPVSILSYLTTLMGCNGLMMKRILRLSPHEILIVSLKTKELGKKLINIKLKID